MTPGLAWLIVVRAYTVGIVRARWFWVVFLVCILSSLATILRSHHAYLDAADRYALELQDRQRLRLLPVVPSGRTVEPVLRVLRPPNSVSILVAGVERTMPAAWDFGPSGVQTLPPYPSQISPVSLDVLTDGESVIRLFGGLLGLALGFWLVTTDQQRGWLAAGLSLPVPPWWPLSALMSAGALMLAAIALFWMLVSRTWGSWLLGPNQELGLAFSYTWLFVWMYLVTMTCIGAAVARLTPTPLSGAATVASVWTVLILMGPQLLSAAVFLAGDLVPRARFEYERREAYADRRRVSEESLARRLMAAVPDAPSKSALDAAAAQAFPAVEPDWIGQLNEARAETAALTRTWLGNQALWLGRLQWMSRLTPGTLLQASLATSNGQGWETQRWWEQRMHQHEAALNEALFDDRPVVDLRLYWRGDPFISGFTRHRPLQLAEFPSFDESLGASIKHRETRRADVIAAMLQLMTALSVALLYPKRERR